MFYIFTYIIFGLCTGFLYFLNELISNHFSSWEPHFLSSRILQLVRLEFPFSPAFLHASDLPRPADVDHLHRQHQGHVCGFFLQR